MVEKNTILLALLVLAIAVASTAFASQEGNTLTGRVTQVSQTVEELSRSDIVSRAYFDTNDKLTFHLGCALDSCVTMPGRGKDVCLNTRECNPIRSLDYSLKPAHMGCRENRCLVIWGEGEDTCNSREDCAPEIPKLERPAPPVEEPKEQPKPEPPKQPEPILTLSEPTKKRFESIATLLLRKMGMLSS